MRFGYTIVYVEDVLKTVEFYERALGLKRLFVHESMAYAEMETGQTKLAFASFELAKRNGFEFEKATSSPAPYEIALVSDQVETDFANAVANGAKELKKPIRKPWGQLVGYVRDPNGVIVEICSPISK